MATNDRVIKQICEAFAPAGVTCKKMFGEYGLFVDGKVFALVCDDTLFVKPTPSAQMMLGRRAMRPAVRGREAHARSRRLVKQRLSVRTRCSRERRTSRAQK